MTTTIAPVRKQRTLACTAQHAWHAFTSDIGQWWPTATHAIHDDVADVVLEAHEGGTIHEVGPDGEVTVWGRILEARPPSVLRFSWHLDRTEPTEVEVRFVDTAQGCEVTLVHRNWEAWGDVAQDRRDRYDGGWELVLDQYQSSAIASSSRSSATS